MKFLFIVPLLCVSAFASSLDQGAYNVAVRLDLLVQTYDRNEVAADQQYKGRRISTSGEVYKVTTSESGMPVVELKVPQGSKMFIVRAYFDDARGIANLSANSRVGFYGIVDGMHSGDLVIQHCVLMH